MNALPLTPEQRAAWQSAQALWGVSLHDPLARPDAHEGSFAWFSFPPQVWFDLRHPAAHGIEGCLESIFAHEIGHHVLSPSTKQDSLKIRHQMARALAATGVVDETVPEIAGWCSNVWSDMLINVRVAELQRLRDVDRATDAGGPVEPEMIAMWRILSHASSQDRLWWVVLRAYEMLWSRPAGTLAARHAPAAPEPAHHGSTGAAPARAEQAASDDLARAFADRRALEAALDGLALTDPELDAQALADTVRTFGADPVSGALRFGMIAAGYFAEQQRASGIRDPAPSGAGSVCGGQLGQGPASPGDLVAVLADARLHETPEHPAAVGLDQGAGAAGTSAGQGYGAADTLRLYAASDQAAVLSAWYQAEAKPWVRPLVQASVAPVAADDAIPGALEEWSLGDDLSAIDWVETLGRGTTVIPGVTTLRRDSVPDAPPPPRESVHLDLYIDSSGSMPSPSSGSPAVLAGTILLLSALRGGGRVRVTSFSGAGQVAGMEGFTRDRTLAFAYLTTFFAGGTVFPLDLYASRYRTPPHLGERRHVVVLSDDGLSSLFGAGQSAGTGVAADVRRRLDTATLLVQDPRRSVEEEARDAGYDTLYVDDMRDAPKACVELARRLLAPPEVTGTAAGSRRGARG
ncbi:VWA domain-containing protein [Frondihabitans australicus]|uniref:VWA domain-containing protein n=1 Tax=Frondihabitans australicus TaxID=386892 RepID=A0A495ICU5_9MICO|nr:VWA domain-containing protein [Frondihabitans australicus]RKR73827.1 hypothetical protein C8E83_0924 [Frondihabitans australicus]